MIVVSDTTPLNYLILIESVHALPALFGRVYAPSAVLKELSHPKSPEAVRAWASNLPPWLTVQDPTEIGPSKLGLGEAAAISLALELKAERVLIDDRDASREAVRSGLNVVGTLGILEEAAKRRLLDFEEKIAELKETNFRASDKLYQTVLERVKEQMTKAQEGPMHEGPEEPKK
jgi:predicted nucleic acid-binding protein